MIESYNQRENSYAYLYTEVSERRPGQHCGLRNHFTHKARISIKVG
jgi:hypothetical protein